MRPGLASQAFTQNLTLLGSIPSDLGSQNLISNPVSQLTPAPPVEDRGTLPSTRAAQPLHFRRGGRLRVRVGFGITLIPVPQRPMASTPHPYNRSDIFTTFLGLEANTNP